MSKDTPSGIRSPDESETIQYIKAQGRNILMVEDQELGLIEKFNSVNRTVIGGESLTPSPFAIIQPATPTE